jgi:hypothetical protein
MQLTPQKRALPEKSPMTAFGLFLRWCYASFRIIPAMV